MNNKRTTTIPFGLLNIGGLMASDAVSDGKNNIIGYNIRTPLFCNESYKIKPTLNPIHNKLFGFTNDDGGFYQKNFRRMVLWDFGDGYTEEGYSVEHHYERPGRYRITCTLYDINRVAWKNLFYVEVVVKELLPTMLQFNKKITKSEIKCSKIERIAQLEAFLSQNCNNELQICANRIFSEEEHDEDCEEIGRSFIEIKPEIFKFVKKYWTFLENTQEKAYRSNDIYKEHLKPCNLFTPSYQSIYGRFYYDENNLDEPIQVALFYVNPYKIVDEKYSKIRILNPNSNLEELTSFKGNEEEYNNKFTKEIALTQVYNDEQIPNNAYYIGKRAFVDIFYKSDYISDKNTLFFHYDIENKNITNDLITSDNYLNMNPIGMSVKITNNDTNDVKIGVTLDGFLRNVDKNKNYTVDEYLMNSLVDGVDIDFYFIPYIEYDGGVANMEYYIPKDFIINGVVASNDGGSQVIGNLGHISNLGESVTDQLWRARVLLKDNIKQTFVVSGQNGWGVEVLVEKDPLIMIDDITIPTEKRHNEDVKRLVDAYTQHPMFDESHNVKEFFERILGQNDFLNYTMTRSNNFLDDRANVKTCYLSNLISMLKMMGEEIIEYEKGSFEGVNDLRDFVRLLSMNHSDLVGHEVSKPYDIEIKLDKKGKNVSDKIEVTDVLGIKGGKIQTVTRNGKIQTVTNGKDKDGAQIIIQDKYTNETKIVNFGLVTDGTISIENYDKSWGWNLLLPLRFETCVSKLRTDEQYASTHSGVSLYSQSEKNRLRETIRQIIDGYYSFYLLDEKQEKKRIGNFLDGQIITEEIEDSSEWEKEWGLTHEILMKIISESGGLKYKGEEEQSSDGGTTYDIRKRTLNQGDLWMTIDKQVAINCYVGGERIKDFQGTALILGCADGEGEHTLQVSLSNCELGKDVLKTEIEWLELPIVVDKNLDISLSKHNFIIEGKNYLGTLEIILYGRTDWVQCEANVYLIQR